VFDDIALTRSAENALLSGTGHPERIHVHDATPNFFVEM
jgi:hypothetical protein